MILGMKAIKGILYVEALLKKIKMVKNFQLFDIEKGNQILIPQELSQSNLPYSFRYYDPIIAIIQENVSDYRREHLAFKQ